MLRSNDTKLMRALDRIRRSMRILPVVSVFWALLSTIPVSDVHLVMTIASLEASSETQRT